MSDELIFYTNPQSRGRIVRWMLEEVGRSYRTEIIDYAAMKDPGYLAVNPMGKVPAITHHGWIVTECAAICAYLADAFPEAGLAPPLGDRADYYRWIFFAAGPLEQAWTHKAMAIEVPPERERMVGYGTFARTLDTLESAIEGHDYIAGDRFSAADLYVGASLGFGMQFGIIEKRPTFAAYVGHLMARPAYKRATELDEAATPTPTNT